MREILFRGKNKYGKWYYGYYLDGTPVSWIEVVDRKKKDTECPTVIPETVGQYTGLTDKNGKRIFEGDIVLIDGSDIGHVEYTEKYAMFEGVFGDFREDFQFWVTQYPDILVIGNIHDNPELLEGDRDGN